jgi:hypothetical protein
MYERDQFKESDMGRLYSTNVGVKNAYKDMDRRAEGMRPVGRYLCRWILKI